MSEPAPPAQSLDQRVIRSYGWVALGTGGKNLASILAMLVLVRLLEPESFGLVSLAATFVLVIEFVQASGLGAALIYRRNDIEEAAGTAFVYAAAAGIASYGVVFALAPFFADIFNAPDLTDVVRVLSLLLVIRGFGTGPGSILERELDFRARTKGELSAALANFSVAVGLAFAGFGVWSLVAGSLAGAGVGTIAVWLLVPWRPSPRKASLRVLRELIRYGRFVSAGNLITFFARQSDNIVVGRVLGTSALGYYAVAFRLAAFPNSVIGTMVGRVAFPAYAMLQDDLPAFRRAFIQTLQRVALLAAPISVSLIVAGDPIVLGLFGEKWLPATDALRILAVYGLVTTFTSPCGAVYQAAGKPHLVPLWALPSAIVLLPALILLVPRYGVTGAAVAMLVAYSCSSVPALIVAMRLLELRLIEILRSLAPSIACSALLGLTLALLLPARNWMSPPLALIVLVAAGAIVYIGSTAVLARSVVAPMLIGLRSSRT